MSDNHAHNRALQQDARAWAAFTGTRYTAAMRQMASPLAQGLLGERVSARHLIAVLNDHEIVGARGGDPLLGEDGYMSTVPWRFDGETDFIELALIIDMLRMFTPTAGTTAPEVSSYSLKHTAERFLSPRCSYVSNGRLIWAAAGLGLPIADTVHHSLNLLIGVHEREHDYVSRASDRGRNQPRAHHHRPVGYTHLQTALARAAAGEIIAESWVRPTIAVEAAPFHDWLIQQADRDNPVGDLARDYTAGIRDSEHGVAHTPGDLLTTLSEVPRSDEAYDAAVRAIAEWMRTVPTSAPVRTKMTSEANRDHQGWGAGTGTLERYEYRCPCGDGYILEEHDNTPGFREHDVHLHCDTCRTVWRFAEGRSVRDWGLEPVHAGARN
ncbi:hypothetical protein [Catellatospora methionotrophica]|uniref:hypothetical protein n=1 Tax=Catellatospora methionotrophica TaxID=121620 RepID=UPI0033C4028A